MIPTVEAPVADGFELAVIGGDPGLDDTLDQLLLVRSPVGDEVCDRPHEEIVLLGEPFDVVELGDGPVVVHQLRQHRSGVQTGELHQIDTGFGVAGASQHSAVGSPQRIHVSGPGDVDRPGVRVDERKDGLHPIRRRDAGRDTLPGIDGEREGRAMRLGVEPHHLREFQLVEPLCGHRHADDPGGVANHECHLPIGDLLCGDDQVAFVLPILVVGDDHHLAGADGGDQLFGAGKLHLRASSSRSTYFARISTSRFTVSPADASLKDVTSSVCGMRAI